MEIQLTQGKVALVDDADYEWLNQWNWCVSHEGYAKRVDENRKTVYMHRLLSGATENLLTDHINRNTVDNRRCNLRVCTHSENRRNRGRTIINTTGYKGVSLKRNMNKWTARITVNYKEICLGSFSTPEEAARKYDEAALMYHGKFAFFNLEKK